MIIIKIVGGLASQLHKYAIGRTLALKNQTELKLDISWYANIPYTDTIREFQLDRYNIESIRATQREIQYFKPNKVLRRINTIIFNYIKIKLGFKYYCNESYMSLENFNSLPKNLYIEGEWTGHKYLSKFKEVLKKDLTLRDEYMSNINCFFSQQKKDFNLVSLHVRRGDYVHNSETSKLHCTCSIDYYKKAIKYITSTIPRVKLLIFSDDMPWVKKHFDILDDIELVFIEGFQDYEEFQIMTQCQHNIIANSSFSWLSSWLNNNPNKIVISPSKWVYNDQLNNYIVDNISETNMLFFENL